MLATRENSQGISQIAISNGSSGNSEDTDALTIHSSHVALQEQMEVSGHFSIPLNVWNNLVAGGKRHKFGNLEYRKVLLGGISSIYSNCVPAFHQHYIMHDSDVNFSEDSDCGYRGNAKLYCMHYMCCGCEVNYKIEFWLQKVHSYIESRLSVSGWRKHTGRCVRSRPIRGETRSAIREKLQFCSPAALRDKLYSGLSTEQRALGSFVDVAHPDVYRKIKSERQDYNKFKNWDMNVQKLRRQWSEAGYNFVRSIKIHPAEATFFSDFQIRVFNELTSSDILYFDATGSIVKGQDFQIYTL